MNKKIRSSDFRALSFILALALALPLSWKGLTGFYNWLSPFIMLNSVFALKSFVWLNIFGLVIIIFVIFRKRWFCTNMCPVGFCCDRISELSRRKPTDYSRLPDINRWAAVISLTAAIAGIPLFIFFDPLALFNGFFSSFTGRMTIISVIGFSVFPLLLIIHLFFPGIWCSKLCPLGGFQLVIDDIKNLVVFLTGRKRSELDTGNSGRRYFIMSGIGLLAGFSIPSVLKPERQKKIRPPASVSPLLFNSLCCRCGSCIKACPTGIIVHNTDLACFTAFMTPEVTFEKGYCLEDCNLCSSVCPTGAITLFSIEAKPQIFMGTAIFSLENCLLLNNTECVKCRESCKYGAIELSGEAGLLCMVPVVDADKCVGCGACQVICPESCIRITSCR